MRRGLAILVKNIVEALVLPFAKAQVAELRYHHRPTEDRSQEESRKDGLPLKRAFHESVNNSCGDHVLRLHPANAVLDSFFNCIMAD